MKRLYLSLAAVLIASAASAQVYVGGLVGLWRNTDDNHSKFNIVPEVGYNISDKWAVGTGVAYTYYYDNGVNRNAFGITPYVRYTAAKLGPVSFLLDGRADYVFVKFSGKKVDSNTYNVWQVGISPAIKVSLSKKIDFIAECGFLGYRDYDDTGSKLFDCSTLYGEKGFGFSFSSNDLSFGMLYNF